MSQRFYCLSYSYQSSVLCNSYDFRGMMISSHVKREALGKASAQPLELGSKNFILI